MQRRATILTGIIVIILLITVVLPAIGHYRRVNRGTHVERLGATAESPNGKLKCIVSTVGPGQGKEQYFRLRLYRMPEMELLKMLELEPSEVPSDIDAEMAVVVWDQDSSAAVVTITDGIVFRCAETGIRREK